MENDDLDKCGDANEDADEVEDHGETKWVEEKETIAERGDEEEVRWRSSVMRKGR